MHLLREYKAELTAFLLISVLYFILRLTNLTLLPIFTDEAIYLRWAQIALNDAQWRFISLTDGKQPLYVWAVMLVMKFVSDPLLAGRLVSVLTGFGTMIGLWFLSYELFKRKKIAYLTSLFYVVYPFAQVHDRLAIYDSMVAFLFVWSTYFSVLLVRFIRLDIAYTLGIVIGFGVLNKATNFFSIYLLPFMLLLFDWKQKNRNQRLIRFGMYAVFATVISYALYSLLRLSPFFHIVDEKTATFVIPPADVIKKPLGYLQAGDMKEFNNYIVEFVKRFWGNLNGLTSWLLDYLTIFYTFLIGFAIYKIRIFKKEKLLLLVYFLIPYIVLAFFGIVIFPRFIFFMSLMLLPVAAWSLNYILEVYIPQKLSKKVSSQKKIVVSWVVIGLFIVYPLIVSLQFTYNPMNAPLAYADREQYVNSWAAGWGVKESVEYLENEARDKKIFVGTEGTFGLMPYALELYLVENKNITLKGYWPIGDELPEEAIIAAQKMPAYFIFYQPQHQVIPETMPVKLLVEKKAGNSKYSYRLYQIVPENP